MDLKEALTASRKSELQAWYLFWFPGERMVPARDGLAHRLLEAMSDPREVRDRFVRLQPAEQNLLRAILGSEGRRCSRQEVRLEKAGSRIEDYEFDQAVRGLAEKGFICTTTSRDLFGRAGEVYAVPSPLGEALLAAVPVEKRSPVEMMTLQGRLTGSRRGRASGGDAAPDLPALAEPSRVEERIRELGTRDPDLAGVARTALCEFGGILTPSRYRHATGSGAAMVIRPGWREALEESHLGTTGVLSLKDAGIEVEEEGVFIFQEIVHQRALAEAGRANADELREVSLGVDLLIDLERLVEVLRAEGMEITREGTLRKKSEESLAGCLVTRPWMDLFEGRLVETLVALAGKLGLVAQEPYGQTERLRADPAGLERWRGKGIHRKLQAILDLFLVDRSRDRSSFHQRDIRQIFREILLARPRGGWLRMRPLLAAAVSRYLVELDRRGVEREFRARWNDDFYQERLVVPLSHLSQDLSCWVVHRLGLLGVVDLGLAEGRVDSIKLSRLGSRLFGVDGGGRDPAERALVVNPDFEVLLFPGNGDLNYDIARFAERVGWDTVKRYQIRRESITRGLRGGMGVDEILGVLAGSARSPLPQNVTYSIREWAERV